MRAHEFMRPRPTPIGAGARSIDVKREGTAVPQRQRQTANPTIEALARRGSAGQKRDAPDRPKRG
jgi:hypothetical protein